MVVACADFCFNVIAFQDEMDADEMDANKKKRKKWLDQQKKWLFYQAKLASTPQSSRRSLTLVDALQLEAAKYIPSERAKESQRECERKIPAGGARGPRAGENSHSQLV